MNLIKVYRLIKEAYDGLEYLVENPKGVSNVKEDIREERNKLLEAMELMETLK